MKSEKTAAKQQRQDPCLEDRARSQGCRLSVGYLPQSRVGETIALWEHCFPEDGPAFLDYYYTQKTLDNRILAGELNGKIVSMLHRNPYGVIVKGRSMTLDYIVAVATFKAYRGRGYMRSVLTRALLDMNREGRAFTFLMPAAEAIYSPYDFRYIGDLWKTQLNSAAQSGVELVTVKDTLEDETAAAMMMERWLAGFDVHTKRSRAYVHRLCLELKSDGGELYFLRKNGAAAGLLALWGTGKQQQRLLYAKPPLLEITEKTPGIMGRITNVQTFLPIFGFVPGTATNVRAVKLILDIKDAWIPANEGRFLWTLNVGYSLLEPLPKEAAEKEEDLLSSGEAFLLTVSIADMTLWLFGKMPPDQLWPCAPKPLQKVLQCVDVIHSVYLDEIV